MHRTGGFPQLEGPRRKGPSRDAVRRLVGVVLMALFAATTIAGLLAAGALALVGADAAGWGLMIASIAGWWWAWLVFAPRVKASR